MVTEEHLGTTSEASLRDLSEALIAVWGTDYGIHSPTSISRFTDMARQAAAYRERRVLLAGDAAHVHNPGAQTRSSGRGLVFVEQSAEEVAPPDLSRVEGRCGRRVGSAAAIRRL